MSGDAWIRAWAGAVALLGLALIGGVAVLLATGQAVAPAHWLAVFGVFCLLAAGLLTLQRAVTRALWRGIDQLAARARSPALGRLLAAVAALALVAWATWPDIPRALSGLFDPGHEPEWADIALSLGPLVVVGAVFLRAPRA